MNRSITRRAAQAAILAAVGSTFFHATTADAAVAAAIVPGTLVQGTVKASLTGGSYANEANNLGDWPLTTGGGATQFPVTLTNANFNGNLFGGTPNTMIAFGNGGGVTLKFTAPIAPVAGQKELGLFTAQMLLSSDGSLFNGNMEAAILVSADQVNWRTLSGEAIASPTTYTATSFPLNAPTLAYDYVTSQQAWNYGSGTPAANLAALAIADYQTPMPDDHLFNGATASAVDRKALAGDASPSNYDAIFGGSGGGNWFDISACGLDHVQYLRLNGVNVPTTGGIRLDAVYASAAATPEPSALALFALTGAFLIRRRH